MAKDTSEKKIKKVDMVREAVKVLGGKAKNQQIRQYILDTYQVDMTINHISQTKSNERRKKGKVAPGRKPREAAAPVVASPAASQASSANIGDILEFVEMVRIWENKIGSENIKEVVKKVFKKI